MPMRLLQARARKEQSEAFVTLDGEVKYVMISKTRASNQACMYYEKKLT